MRKQNRDYKALSADKEKYFLREHGFTLVEVMISMVILLVGILGVIAMQYYSVRGNAASREVQIATNLSQEVIEQMKGTPYANLAGVSPGTDNPLPVAIPDTFTVSATSGGINYTRAWWVVPNCTELGGNGTLCAVNPAPACSTVPDGAVVSPSSAIRARTCWTDANGTPHSVTLDSLRWGG